MSDPHPTKAPFDARLRALGLDTLPEAEIARLWKSYVKQQQLSARLDDEVPPATEPAIALICEEGRR